VPQGGVLAATLVEREGRLFEPRDVYRSAIVWWGRDELGG